MQQRYYDPIAGRFLSVDPVTTDANSGDSFNRYVYARNNPYFYTDPDGRYSTNACVNGPGSSCTSYDYRDGSQSSGSATSSTPSSPTTKTAANAPAVPIGPVAPSGVELSLALLHG